MQTVVGVLRGGPSREHDVSLKTGAAMLANLPEAKYLARDIYIDKQGVWHDRGRPTRPDKILRQVDVVLNGLHGEYGEDGEVQKLLERFGVRYVGSDPFGSHLAIHKVLSKAAARDAGLLVPDFRLAERPEDAVSVANEAIRSFHQPVVVKPVSWGSSVGVAIVGGYAPVLGAIQKIFEMGAPGVIVEELIKGREATAGVVEGLRGESFYTLPIVEIVPPNGDFYSLDAKYNGSTKHICPGNFSRVVTEELQRAARLMHRTLGQRHYSRSDFIVSPRGVYYLETNSLPGLTADSNVPIAHAAVGITSPEFLSHLIRLALNA